MSNATPIIRQAGEGEHLGFAGGGVFTVQASAAETGGAFLLMTHRSVGGKSTPLHTHPEDEAIYVLEGELLVHMDGEEHRVGQGGFFLAPSGVPHAMLVTSETAHMLALQAPGTGESFYREGAIRSTRPRMRPGLPTGSGCAGSQSGRRASSSSVP